MGSPIANWFSVRTKWPLIPLILVSGTLSEELATDSFKSGATDCVSKTDLSRLVPAVHRALREVEERAERRRLALARASFRVIRRTARQLAL